ncbi:MAG: DUF2007 domain-containing protein [Candidatus Ancaeobacter aquaticus]|nr:DUF2007 domain-containing protein [Candidatus Ancaeobacter aquaticus]
MSDELVTIATFDKSFEAHMYKSKLEAAGIECFLADENIVGLNWFLSPAVGFIKLQVRESDIARAQNVMDEKIDMDDAEIAENGNEEE